NARLAGKRLGNLDHLAARKRQVLDEGKRVDVGRTGAPQGLFGYAALRLAGDQAEPLGRVRYDDVIGDAEFRNEGEFLEDAYDACPRRIHRRRKADRLPIKADLAFVGCNDPRQYLDERRLARAVL